MSLAIEDYKDYELDIKRTLIGSIPFFYYLLLVIFFIIFFLDMYKSITDDSIRIIALIVFCFTTIKLIGWIGTPELQYKLRIQESKGGKS